MPAKATHDEAAVLSTCTYRIWIYTSAQDKGGADGKLNLCLGGALGSKWLMRVDAAIPLDELYATGQQCEFFQEAEDVGTLHTLTVEYGDTVSDRSFEDLRFGQSGVASSSQMGAGKAGAPAAATCRPWLLSHIIVRNSATGMVFHFPHVASTALTGPTHLVRLEPRLTVRARERESTRLRADPALSARSWRCGVLCSWRRGVLWPCSASRESRGQQRALRTCLSRGRCKALPLLSRGTGAASVFWQWHEDRFGNTAEQSPPPPPTGQWHWPMLTLPTRTGR
eukprot:4841604-Prymnesium_polylepis.1